MRRRTVCRKRWFEEVMVYLVLCLLIGMVMVQTTRAVDGRTDDVQHGIYAYKSGVYITGSEITENMYGVYLYEAEKDVKIITDYLGDGSHEKEISFSHVGEDIRKV